MQIPLGMPGVAPRRTGVGHFLKRHLAFWRGLCFFTLGWYKRIWAGDDDAHRALQGSLTPLWQCILPARQSRPAQNFPGQTALINISVPTSLGCNPTRPGPQAFFEIANVVARLIEPFISFCHCRVESKKTESAACATGKLSLTNSARPVGVWANGWSSNHKILS